MTTMIEVLTVADCPHAEETLSLLKAILRETRIAADVEHVVVADEQSARKLKFPGSPTIRFNGRDLESDAASQEYGLACRVYRDGNSLRGVPPAALILAALREYDA
jgi:glutaredoxin